MPLRSSYSRCAASIAMLLHFCVGCSEPEPIVTYTVPTKVPAQLLPGKDRMLVTMVPQGDKVWFFKVTGPETAIDLIEQDFRQFVTTIQFNASKPNLKQLPSGWRRAGEKAMRYASINIETPTKQLDLSVSNLSRPEDGETPDEVWDNYVLINVNRWRNQLGLENSQDKWAGGESVKIETADGPSVWVDLLGESSTDSPMSPPFANHGGMPHRTQPNRTQPSQAATRTSADSKLKFDRPDGWRDGKMSSMRMAAFYVGPEASQAEVTVIQAGGDLRGNVARWIGQVRGGSPAGEVVDAALQAAQKIQVNGFDAQRFLLTGEEPETGDAIDATIIPMQSGSSMFIKMTGPAPTVTDQGDKLASFLESLKF